MRFSIGKSKEEKFGFHPSSPVKFIPSLDSMLNGNHNQRPVVATGVDRYDNVPMRGGENKRELFGCTAEHIFVLLLENKKGKQKLASCDER